MPNLVVGYLFMTRPTMDVRVESPEGKVPVFGQESLGTMFYGIVSDPEEKAGKSIWDWMEDEFLGMSEVVDFSQSGPTKITFTRRCDKRSEDIRFELHRSGGIWLGKYSGPKAGVGTCQCVFTRVGSNFFSPVRAMKEFGMEEPHVPIEAFAAADNTD